MAPTRRRELTVRQVRLSVLDWPGHEPAVLLLHGLAGQATEWSETARWLNRHHRVVALDQRGHGDSQKGLKNFSSDAYVEDAAAVVTLLGLAPVVLVGQSMGGVVAFRLAARRPKLVKALVVVEADPGASPHRDRSIERWLDSWPLPFKTRQHAAAFFGGDNLKGKTWAATLRRKGSGYWPTFRREDMLATASDATDHWTEWKRISCPTLVVVGAQGLARRAAMRRMASTLANARYVELPDAGHDLHLELPDEWRKTLLDFLDDPS